MFGLCFVSIVISSVPSKLRSSSFNIFKNTSIIVNEESENAEITIVYRPTVPETAKLLTIRVEWENTNSASIPEQIVAVIDGSDGSQYTRVISAADNWQISVYLPGYDSYQNEINYTISENEVEGYTCNVVQGIEEKYIAASPIAYNHDYQYVFSKTGLDIVPISNYQLVPGTYEHMYLDNVEVTALDGTDLKDGGTSNGLSYIQDAYISRTSSDGDVSNVEGVIYTGEISAKANGVTEVQGGYRIRYNEAMIDKDGNLYDLVFTVRNITIVSTKGYAASKGKSIWMAYTRESGQKSENDIFNLSAEQAAAQSGQYTSGNLAGVAQEVTVEVYDQNGQPAEGYIQYSLADIDIEDKFSGKYLATDEYIESVEPLTGVSSPVYATADTYVVQDGNRFRASKETTTAAGILRSTIVYGATADSSSLLWKGSGCGTAITFNDFPSGSNAFEAATPTVITNKGIEENETMNRILLRKVWDTPDRPAFQSTPA